MTSQGAEVVSGLPVDLQLADKIAIVTGSTRGLGFATATALLEEGCNVTICARGEDGLAEAMAKLRDLPGGTERVLAIQADVSTEKGVADVIFRTVETFGGIDILVNNVGIGKGSDIIDTPDSDWYDTFDQTLYPAIRASRMAIPHMRTRGGGSIVMIASIWGRESGGRMTYNAVKAAEISLAKAMAQQLAKDNIRVNSVAPGSIRFPGGSWDRRVNEDPDGMAEFVRRELPFGRFGRPEEVGAVVAFLVSPRASWISGASVTVDGCQSRSLI
jgi:3-oxoacyl-[acyl-carrier protein] reductase